MDTDRATAIAVRRRAVRRAWLGEVAGALVLIYGLVADIWWLALGGFVAAGMSYTSLQSRRKGGDADVGSTSGSDGSNDDDANGGWGDSDGGD